jgi:fatty acid synthase, animal type
MGPVGGIFSLAAILENEYFANLSPTTFANTFYAKAYAAIYLDEISRTSCPELDHFLVFSSIASGRGAITQSNYAMANCVTERLVERRHADGLPGKAIEWGPVAGIGMLETFEKQSFHGLNLQPIASCLELIDYFLLSSEVICCSWHYSDKVKFQKKDSFFDILVQVLGIGDWSNIRNDSTLSDIGVDSMSGTEIQHILGRDFGVDISLKDLRMKTVDDIKKFLK